MVTTLTSPGGRTTTATSSRTNSYSTYITVETVLPWDWNDLGDYSTQSRHWMCCPHMGGNPYTGAGCYPSGSSASQFRVGASIAVYRSTFCQGGECPTACGYEIIPNCDTSCKQQQITTNRRCAYYLIRTTPFQVILGRLFCLRLNPLDQESANEGLCYDLDTS